MKNGHSQKELLIPQHPKLILSVNGRQATSSETFPDKFIYLLQPLNINYNKDYILIHLCLLTINYTLDILEDTINIRDSPCFQKWQTTKIFFSPSSWTHDCPAILQFPAFFLFQLWPND